MWCACECDAHMLRVRVCSRILFVFRSSAATASSALTVQTASQSRVERNHLLVAAPKYEKLHVFGPHLAFAGTGSVCLGVHMFAKVVAFAHPLVFLPVRLVELRLELRNLLFSVAELLFRFSTWAATFAFWVLLACRFAFPASFLSHRSVPFLASPMF